MNDASSATPGYSLKGKIALAWPLALNALLMQSMLMIDTFLVSPLGEVPLAAMGIAGAIVAFVMGVQMALANGTQLVLSRAIGANNALGLSRGYRAGLVINGIAAGIFWCALILFKQPLIEAITSDVATQIETLNYLAFSQHLILFNACTQVMIALFNGSGRSKVPFKGYLIEMPLNALFSYCLIYGINGEAGLGVEGAALGSLLAIAVRFVYLNWCLRKVFAISLTEEPLNAAFRRNIVLHFKEITPIAANVTMLQIGVSIYQLLYAQLNLYDYVAITLIMPWLRSGTQFITAWAHSSAIIVSQQIGSNQFHDLRRNIDSSIDIAVAISIITAGCFYLLSLVIDRFYPDLDVATYEALTLIAPLYIFLPLLRGYNTVHGHVLRALGKTTAVFKINFIGQWVVSIPLCAVIILGLDGSIFWAFAIQPFEEVIKALPFRHLARKSLQEFDQTQAEKLMYS
ncbi:MATE family efflux transporter [Vibrio sp. SM6]|uniref:MATE family efflux transporter n=1 Tax=Vibrio agarilyticus TaxID=2726741 RepID=A0A7X8YH57_9VIBR|nr:MATE family efflux transporter [Vibrio agarilyticus]NLS13748.1 MATE family efflux transporter [Vibrio agarilyticus]